MIFELVRVCEIFRARWPSTQRVKHMKWMEAVQRIPRHINSRKPQVSRGRLDALTMERRRQTGSGRRQEVRSRWQEWLAAGSWQLAEPAGRRSLAHLQACKLPRCCAIAGAAIHHSSRHLRALPSPSNKVLQRRSYVNLKAPIVPAIYLTNSAISAGNCRFQHPTAALQQQLSDNE